MSWLRNASIKRKLTLLLATACTFTSLLCCTAFVWNDVRMIKAQTVQQMSALVSRLGANSVSALLFDDPAVANDVLASLQLEESAEFACTFDATGKIVAYYGDRYQRPYVFTDRKSGGNRLTVDGYLEVIKPIVHNGEHVGAIFVRSNLDQLDAQLSRYGLIVASVLAFTGAFAIFGSSMLQRVISQPLERLATAMRNVSAGGDYSHLVEKTSEDELGTLCDGFNDMLSQIQRRDGELRELHQQLVQTARQAGQAEVATSVLHNVGNVLNSVNVAASMLAERVQASQITNVEAVADLLSEQEDVGEFFTSDQRGKMLPGFLAQLGEQLSAEQRQHLQELDQLQTNIEHIKQIVRAQQSYAGLVDVPEPCELRDVIEEAYAISGISLKRHGIDMERQFDEVPTVHVVKAKLLQLLVNLIKNAKEALRIHDSSEKTITIRLRVHEDWARVEIADNGPGIPLDKLREVFAYGFTTKSHGHGFGLHSAANAATEMRGSLSAHSDGPGSGATFVLELPLDPKATAAAPFAAMSPALETTDYEPQHCEANP
jgi:signal transduction histidine kinase